MKITWADSYYKQLHDWKTTGRKQLEEIRLGSKQHGSHTITTMNF